MEIKRKQLDAGPSFEHWLPKQLGGGAEKRVLKKYGWDDFAIANTPTKATHYFKSCV